MVIGAVFFSEDESAGFANMVSVIAREVAQVAPALMKSLRVTLLADYSSLMYMIPETGGWSVSYNSNPAGNFNEEKKGEEY